MANGRSLEQIIKDAEAAHKTLAEREQSIQREINALDDVEWDRPLNKTEQEKRRQLRTAQDNTRAAKTELSFVTLGALNQSSEVQRLVNAFKGINADLKSDLKRLEKIEKVAAATVKSIAAIEKVAQELAKKMAMAG